MPPLQLELTRKQAQMLADELMWTSEAVALAWPLFRNLVLDAAAARLDGHARGFGDGSDQIDEDEKGRRAIAADSARVCADILRGMRGRY